MNGEMRKALEVRKEEVCIGGKLLLRISRRRVSMAHGATQAPDPHRVASASALGTPRL